MEFSLREKKAIKATWLDHFNQTKVNPSIVCALVIQQGQQGWKKTDVHSNVQGIQKQAPLGWFFHRHGMKKWQTL
jgi:hypothetical protein